MGSTDSSRRIPDTVSLVAALAAAAILWWYRDVMPVDIAMRVGLTLLWLLVWTVAALGAGTGLARLAFRTSRFDISSLPVALLAGAGVLGTSAAFLALVGLFRSPILIALLLIAFGWGFRQLWSSRRLDIARWPIGIPLVGMFMIAVGAAIIPVLSAPPVMYDTLNYHLAFPSQWLEAGGFVEFPRHGFSYYTSLYGMLYAYALALVGPWGATAIHYWFGVVAALTAASLGHRLGGATTAWWSAACFVLTPAVLEVSTYASADLAVAAWGACALTVLLPIDGERLSVGRWIVFGILLGCAIAAKYLAVAIVFFPLAIVAIPMLARSSFSTTFRHLFAAGFGASIPLLPWFARNLSWTGNPLYPYLQGSLGGPPTHMSVGIHVTQITGVELGTLDWFLQALTALATRTLFPLDQGGYLGPLWLLLLPIAALARWRGSPRSVVRGLWLYTLAGVFAWGLLVQMARFLLPVLVAAAALAGYAADGLLSSPRSSIRWCFRALIAFILVWNATMIATTQNLERLGVAAGHISASDYQQRWISYFPAIQLLNQGLDENAKVFFVAEPRSLYIERDVVIEDPFQTPLLVELAIAGLSAEDMAAHLRGLGVTHVLFNAVEMPLAAGLRGVDRYWDGPTPLQQQEISEFFDRWVTRMAGNETLWLGELVSPG